MRNYIQKGDNLTFTESGLTHPSHSDGFVDSGDPVCIGRIVGVANTSAAAATDSISVQTRGVVDVSVTTVHNGISIGETLYIDQSSGVVSDDLTDTPYGVALETISVGTGTDTINVLLFQATPGVAGAFS